jgi:hypothetical protein
MAHLKLRQAAQAQQCLERIPARLQTELSDKSPGSRARSTLTLQERLELELLFHEAQALMREKGEPDQN